MSDQIIKLSLRLDLPDGTRFGPGKAALLGAISDSGSISAAAKLMGMSYPRALRLIGEMNMQFQAPLVTTFQGGAKRGGATVTDAGVKVLRAYRETAAAATSSGAPILRNLSDLLRP